MPKKLVSRNKKESNNKNLITSNYDDVKNLSLNDFIKKYGPEANKIFINAKNRPKTFIDYDDDSNFTEIEEWD